MAKLLKMFIALALGLIAPFSIMAVTENPADEIYNIEDQEDFDLKNLEDELRRLLEENPEEMNIPESDEMSIPEKDTLIINPSEEGDEVEQLEIEYKEPMTKALEQELKNQPAKEEVIILNEDEEEEL